MPLTEFVVEGSTFADFTVPYKYTFAGNGLTVNSTIVVYSYDNNNDGNASLKINAGLSDEVSITGTTGQWTGFTITAAQIGILKNIELSNVGSGSGYYLGGVKVDGKLLVESSVYNPDAVSITAVDRGTRDQGQVFSSDAVTTGNNTGNVGPNGWWGAYPATNQFDGTLTNYSHANGNGGPVKVTQTFDPPLPCISKVEFLGGLTSNSTPNDATISVNGGTPVSLTEMAGLEPTATDITEVAFSGLISQIVIDEPVTAAGLLCFGYKVDGNLLIDGLNTDPRITVDGGSWIGVDGSGDATWNNSQDWSSQVVNTGAGVNQGPISVAFNGTVGPGAADERVAPLSGQSLTLPISGITTDSTVTIVGSVVGVAGNLEINGTPVDMPNGGAPATNTYTSADVPSLASGVTSIKWFYSSGYLYLQGIYINNDLLVDSSVPGTGGETKVTGPSNSGTGNFTTFDAINKTINLNGSNKRWIESGAWNTTTQTGNAAGTDFFVTALPGVSKVGNGRGQNFFIQDTTGKTTNLIAGQVLVERSGTSFKADTLLLDVDLDNTDLLLISRNDQSFKVSGADLKSYVNNKLSHTGGNVITFSKGAPVAFHRFGYYPLYATQAQAQTVSGDNTSEALTLGGKTYYMPSGSGVTQFKGNYTVTFSD
jgi:hypothetical protein